MTAPDGGSKGNAEPASLARSYFLESEGRYGCAEAAFMALKTAYGLDDPTDAAPAMALNGGVAYSGGPCGAITGAALAVGLLADRRIDDHVGAKRAAREIVAAAMDAFREAHGATDCTELIGYDLRTPQGHQAFLESGAWRDGCMRQIDWVVTRLAELAEPDAWDRVLREIKATPS